MKPSLIMVLMLALVAFIIYMLYAKKYNEDQRRWLEAIWYGYNENGQPIVAEDKPLPESVPVVPRPGPEIGTGNEDMASGEVDTGIYHDGDVNTLIR